MRAEPPDDPPPGYRMCDMPDGPFTQPLGPLFIRLDGAGFAFRAGERHCNARGVMHGGMLMTFADQTLGLTVQRAVGSIEVATVSLNCDLIDGARPGDFVEGEAMVTRITRSIVFVQGSVRCGDRVLLTASGLWKRLQGSPDSAVPVRQHRTTTHAKPRP
ncbi:MAG: PaaI family thioesterase [Rubrivivax sp.]|jgi:acyl-coenzyme A thioesterase PaaI-like protein|nr:PaaI family thioesterase [Rubrivivax sp.]